MIIGGGLYSYILKSLIHLNSITITESTFTNNTIGDWGGGLCIGCLDTMLHTTISAITNTVCSVNNRALAVEAGLFRIYCLLVHITILTITNSVFTNNSSWSRWGGGLYIRH